MVNCIILLNNDNQKTDGFQVNKNYPSQKYQLQKYEQSPKILECKSSLTLTSK